MIFEKVFLFSLLLLSILFLTIIVYKYRKDYIYLFFQISIIAMVNLDGINVNMGIVETMDILVTILMMFIFLITLFKIQVKLVAPMIVYSIYLLSGVVSTYLSPVPIESLKFLLRQSFFLVLLVMIMNYKISLNKINDLFRLWFLFSVFPSIIALFQVATGRGVRILENIGNDFLTRGYGLTSHPNFLAYYLMITLLVFIILYIDGKIKISKGTAIVIVLIDFTALLFTFSRGALFGLLIGFLVYLWKVNSKKIILVPFLLIGVFFIPGVGERIIEVFMSEDLLTDSSFAWRLETWTQIIGLMDSKNILFGHGFKSVIHYIDYAPHNEYLGFLFETGLMGVLSFYGMIIILFVKYLGAYNRCSLKLKSYYLVGIVLISVSLFVSITDNYFSVPSSIYYFWFLNGILLNISEHYKDDFK